MPTIWSSVQPVKYPVSWIRYHARTTINVIVSAGLTSRRNLILRWASHLDAFSLSLPYVAIYARGRTTGTPGVRPSQSSRTKDEKLLSNFQRPQRIGTELSHGIQTSSRTSLMGEQPTLDLPQLGMRQAICLRCQTPPSMWTLGGISLLSPG